MNIFTTSITSVRSLAGLVLLSLITSAFPAAFFVAEAATQNVTIGVSMVPNPSGGVDDTITLSNPESFAITIEDLEIGDTGSTPMYGPSDLTIGAGSSETLNVTNRLNQAADDIVFSGSNVTTETISYSGTPADDAAVTGSFVITADDGSGTGVVENTDTGETFATIQAAIDDVDTVDGHTIEVQSGVYNESVMIDKSISLLGPNSAISAVTGARAPEAVITEHLRTDVAAGVEVSGFEFTGIQTGPFSIYVIGDSEGFTFNNNRFIDNENVAIKTPQTGVTNNITIAGNLISGVTGANQSGLFLGGVTGDSSITDNKIQNTAYGGIVISTVDSLVISDNEIDSVPQQGIQLATDVSGVTVQNNTITNANTDQAPDKGAIRLYASDVTGSVLITNNTISGGHNGIAIKDGQDVTGKDIVIVDNDILSPDTGVQLYNGGTGELDVKENWWGVDTGIQTFVGSYDAAPWLCGPFATNPEVSSNGTCGANPEPEEPVLSVPERCSVVVDEFTVPVDSAAGADTTVSLDAGRDYFAVIAGTYTFGEPRNGNERVADAEYSLDAGNTEWVKEFDSSRPDALDIFIDGINPDLGSFRSDHTYGTLLTGAGAPVNLAIQDSQYSDNAGSLDVTLYSCSQAIPPEELYSEVTMCKYDAQGNALSGWQLALLGDKYDEVNVETDTNGAVQSLANVPVGEYVVKASGTYKYRNPGLFADAAFSERKLGDAGFSTLPYQPWQSSTVYAPNNYLGLQVNNTLPWGTVFNPAHVYYGALSQGMLSDVDFKVTDTAYGDNEGVILAELYHGRTGITGVDGCVTFNDVPHGQYEIEELLQNDWRNISGLGTVAVDEDTERFNVENENLTPAVTQCSFTLSSNSENTVVEKNGASAVELGYLHRNWIKSLPIAKWIWGDQGPVDPTQPETQTFVNTFGWSGAPIVSAELSIAADNSFSATLNGSVVGEDSGIYNFSALKQYDVSGEVANGYNEFVVTVENATGRNQWLNPAGLYYELTIVAEGEVCDIPYTPPPVTTCSFVSDVAINDEPSQLNVNSNLTTYMLNDVMYESGDEFDLFVTGDTDATGSYQDEVVFERTTDGLEVFFYGNGSRTNVKEFSGTFTLQGVDLTNATIAAGSAALETAGAWPDSVSLNQSTGEVTFTMYTNTGNDSFVISGLSADCGGTPPVFDGSLEITNPATNGTVLSDTHTFTANYQDADDNEDVVYWAIRAGSCNGVDVVGNAPASPFHPSVFDPATGLFETTVDMSTWTNGNYCLVVNPREDDGAEDLRATRTFTLANQVITPLTFTISGFKHEVTGETDEDRTPRAGWTINAYNRFTEDTLSTTTDINGYYYFDVEPGNWVVSEVIKDDWEQVEVRQNGNVVESEGPVAECEFNLGLMNDVGFNFNLSDILISESEDESSNVTCDFDNEFTDEIIAPNPPVGSSASRSSSGTRVVRTDAPTPTVLGAATSTTDFCPFLTEYMQMGGENDSWEVMKLQAFLNIFKDMFGGTENDITGQFDATTDANVKAFQAHFSTEILDPWFELGIVPHNRPTGFVYKTTLWKINSIVCPDYAIEPDFTGETLETNVKI